MAERERPLIKFCHFYRRVARRGSLKKIKSSCQVNLVRPDYQNWVDFATVARLSNATIKRGTNLILESRARRVSIVPSQRVSINYNIEPIDLFVSDASFTARSVTNEEGNKTVPESPESNFIVVWMRKTAFRVYLLR